MATPPEQVMGHLTEEQVARLIYIHETLPGLLPTFLEDTPATEPVLDYITDLKVRCDILEKLQDLVRRYDIRPGLNATALGIVMVAPITVLSRHVDAMAELRFNLRSTVVGFFKLLCETAVDGMRACTSCSPFSENYPFH